MIEGTLLIVAMLLAVISAFSVSWKNFGITFATFVVVQQFLAWYQDYLMRQPDYNTSVGDGFVILVVYFPSAVLIFCLLVRLAIQSLGLLYHWLRKR
ncbi:hypothetical protein [Methylomonas sp. CM2]|uniref:hypothetical protein n=1 Tax=Methylomonas sp. CM2 TaxID=3417647 RepID=UPI003CFAE966